MFGQSKPGGLFGATPQTPGSLFGTPNTQQQTGLFGGTPATPAPTSIFGTALSSQPLNTPQQQQQQQQQQQGTQKFLPGRPSLHDILTVAPTWKAAFDEVEQDIRSKDEHVQQLKSLVVGLQKTNEEQKNSLKERSDVARRHAALQNALETEMENVQPSIRRLHRQCTALATSCQRTLGTTAHGPQSLVIPQSEYLKFVNDLTQKAQELQQDAEALQLSVSLLGDELKKTPQAKAGSLKELLTLQMSQISLLRMRHVALHEELQAVVEKQKKISIR